MATARKVWYLFAKSDPNGAPVDGPFQSWTDANAQMQRRATKWQSAHFIAEDAPGLLEDDDGENVMTNPIHEANTVPLDVPAIAWRYWSKQQPLFYVADVKGKKGDWGYTDRASKAIALSPYQQKRFAADTRAVGVVAHFAAAAAADVVKANPTAKKKPTPAQVAARKLFAQRAKAGTLGGKVAAKNPAPKKPYKKPPVADPRYVVFRVGESRMLGMFDELKNAKLFAQNLADRTGWQYHIDTV